MTTKLSTPVARQVDTPNGSFVVTIHNHGVSIRPYRKRKSVSLPFAEIAHHALAKFHHLRWPEHLQDMPLEQLKHLARRAV